MTLVVPLPEVVPIPIDIHQTEFLRENPQNKPTKNTLKKHLFKINNFPFYRIARSVHKLSLLLTVIAIFGIMVKFI